MRIFVEDKQIKGDVGVYAGNMLLAVSFFSRSLQMVKQFASFTVLKANEHGVSVSLDHERVWLPGPVRASFAQMDAGKDIFYQGLIVSDVVGSNALVVDDESLGRKVYEYLMAHFDWPLLPEWGRPLAEAMLARGLARRERLVIVGDEGHAREMFPNGSWVFHLSYFNEEHLKTMLRGMLESGELKIPGADGFQPVLGLTDLDSYVNIYGPSIGQNIDREVVPLIGKEGEVQNLAFKERRLFPQQCLMVNGAVELLSRKRKDGGADYCFLAMDMGTGKTSTAAAIVEKFFNDRYLRAHGGMSFRELLEGRAVSYRTIVMSPGHLVEKWARELREQVPDATVTVVNDLSQLIRLRKRGKARSGKEFYVIGKDFAKLDYMEQPVPSRMKSGFKVRSKRCNDCGKIYRDSGDICPSCGNKGYTLTGYPLYTAKGLQCPECGRVLLPDHTLTASDQQGCVALGPDDFMKASTLNQKCYWCGTKLWQPFVRNLRLSFFSFFDEEKAPEPSWKRVTVVKNAGTGKKMTVWAHKKYHASIIRDAVALKDDNSGCRKYAPGSYIRRYMKGFFDFFIADEAHEYKGATAQGEVFGALCDVADYRLALTGTLTGGKAQDLFYLLYRLDPRRMQAAGYQFNSMLDFSKKYGTVSWNLKDDGPDDSEVGVSSRTVRRSSPRVEPGISPLVYVDFLLDRAVFLSINDLSSNLPALKEKVIAVRPEGKDEEAMFRDYNGVVDNLVELSKEQFGMLGTMLQFSLSYPDRPYTEGRKMLFTPDGNPCVMIPQHDEFRKMLSSKEKKLVELVRGELQEGRCCFIYCEYTASEDTNVAERLQRILEDELGETVEVLRSDSPQASEREAYLRRVSETTGVRVWITNPKCTETGLDFVWKNKAGVEFNYPTLIFYQIGYSLFTVSQASRRHYRLTQREECRTYYLCWEGTAQETAVGVIAKKMVAAAALQGHFSSEGLQAMVSGTDVRRELFKRIADKDTESGADIQGMFDVLESGRVDDGSFSAFRRMPTYAEVLSSADGGNADAVPAAPVKEQTDVVYFSDSDFEAVFGFGDAV